MRSRSLTRAIVLLAAIDVILLVIALARRQESIRDGAASVTTGGMVAGAILATLLVVLALPLSRLPILVQRHLQLFALLAQTLHALGHLARLYYTIVWYDAVIHVVLTGWVAFLALDVARAWKVIPREQVTPLRAALIVAFAGFALAGIWEIFEYTSDVFFASREQDNLGDTMDDMIAGGIGTLAASAWARHVVRRDRRASAGDRPNERTA